MRTYPPIIVSSVVALVLAAAAFSTIGSKAEQRTEASPAVRKEQPYVTQAAPPTATAAIMEMPTTEAEPESTYESMIMSRDWDAEDSEMLLKIAMAEAEGEGIEGKALVMLVVLNRVWSSEFPGTVEEVIFQSGQFSPVMEGGRYYTTEPDEECYEALELVMLGWDESYGALYFENYGKDSWHSKNLEFLYQVGNHKFYR